MYLTTSLTESHRFNAYNQICKIMPKLARLYFSRIRNAVKRFGTALVPSRNQSSSILYYTYQTVWILTEMLNNKMPLRDAHT